MFNQPVNRDNILNVLNTWQNTPEKSYLAKEKPSKSKTNSTQLPIDSKSPLIVNGKLSKLTTSDVTELIQQRLESLNEKAPTILAIKAGLETLDRFKTRIQEKRNHSIGKRLIGPLRAKIENCCKKRGWKDSLVYIDETKKLLENELQKKSKTNEIYIEEINQYFTDQNMTVRIDRASSRRSLSFDPSNKITTPLLEKTLSLINDSKLNALIDIKNPKYLTRAPSRLNVSQELKVSGEFFEEIHRTLSIQLNDEVLYSIQDQDDLSLPTINEEEESNALPASNSTEQKKFDLIDILTQRIGPVALHRLSTLMTQAGVTDFFNEIASLLVKLVPPKTCALSLNQQLKDNPDEDGLALTILYDDKSHPPQLSLIAEQTFSIQKIDKSIETIGYISYYRQYSAPAHEWSAPSSNEVVIPHLKIIEVFSKICPTVDLAKQEVKNDVSFFSPPNSPTPSLNRSSSLNPLNFKSTFFPEQSDPSLNINE